MSSETDIFPGAAEDVSNELGPSVQDAVEGNFNEQDTREHGISEADRVPLGQHLKRYADSVGTDVISGINSMLAPTAILHAGSMEQKRAVIGGLVDNFGIQDVPAARDPGAGQLSPEQSQAAVNDFIAQNPAAADETVQFHMLNYLNQMREQGYAPDLGQAFQNSVAAHPQYDELVQQAHAQQQASQAREAQRQAMPGVGMVSGSGTSAANQASDDLDSIISEATPHW